MTTLTTSWNITPLAPFGLLAATNPGADIYAVPTPVLEAWTAEHRVVVLRGFEPLPGDALPEFCETLGEILEWELGAVDDIAVRAEGEGHRSTNHEIPFHWDGAFVDRTPHYIFFHCDEAPPDGEGGETLFCDTTLLLELLPPEDREIFEQIGITYATAPIDPRGGTFTSPMLAPHPWSGEATVRYAEPHASAGPVRLQISSVAEELQGAFIEEMRQRLRHRAVCYVHAWRSGDIVIADNHAVLNARRAFTERAPRRIRRVNIL